MIVAQSLSMLGRIGNATRCSLPQSAEGFRVSVIISTLDDLTQVVPLIVHAYCWLFLSCLVQDQSMRRPAGAEGFPAIRDVYCCQCHAEFSQRGRCPGSDPAQVPAAGSTPQQQHSNQLGRFYSRDTVPSWSEAYPTVLNPTNPTHNVAAAWSPAELQQLVKAAQAWSDRLRTEQEQQQQRETVMAEMAAPKIQLQQQQVDAEALKQKLQQQDADTQSMKQQLQQQEAAAEALRQQLQLQEAAAEAVNQKLKADAGDLQEQLRQQQAENGTLLEQLQLHDANATALKNVLQLQEADAEALKQKLRLQDSAAAALQQQLLQREMEVEALKQPMQQLAALVEQLQQHQQRQHGAEFDALKQQVQHLQSKLDAQSSLLQMLFASKNSPEP